MTAGPVRSYYGRPVVRAPVWTVEVPWYFFAGGTAGASATLALGAELAGNRPLARRAWGTALAGVAVSPALLVSDLGVPARFLNMLRLFKPTSPMSVGSWTLAAAGGAISAAAARSLLGRMPRLGRLGALAAGGALGPGLSTYTAVLLADTAVPVWHEARRELPFVFAGGAAASAGAAAAILTPLSHAGPARRLALLGSALEGAAAEAMRRRLGPLGTPLGEGRPGTLSRAAKVLSGAGSLALATRGAGSRAGAAVGGAAVLAGAVCQRFAVYRAGFVSARDPAHTVGPQRARVDGRAAAGGGAR